MKLLFTADIHIKLGQKNVPVDWAKNRFKLFIQQFAAMQKSSDLVVVGGDIFDKLPNMDEMELYFDFVSSITKPCVIYPGNHEMLRKDTTFLSSLKKVTNQLNQLVRIVDDYDSTLLGGDIDIIPYNRLKQYQPNDIDMHGRILCTHVRGEIPPHVKPEIPLELLDRWQVVLAGDLHSYSNCQRNILYPGSPYTTHFHRTRTSTGAILLDVDTLHHEWLEFDLPQLIVKTIRMGEDMPKTDFDHTIYEIEGDMSELASVSESDLIAKKVVKRAKDTSLYLDPKMSLVEEVKEYLTYILELPEPTIEQVLKELFTNVKNLH